MTSNDRSEDKGRFPPDPSLPSHRGTGKDGGDDIAGAPGGGRGRGSREAKVEATSRGGQTADTTYPLHLRRRLILMGAGVGALVLFQILIRIPALAELLYGSGVGPLISLLLSHVSSAVPISLLELVVVFFILRQVVGLVRGGGQVLRRRRSIPNALGAGGLRLGADVGVLLLLFYLLWGFHYARPAMEYQLGLDGVDDGRVEEVVFLAREMVEATNRTYLELHGTEDIGEATTTPSGARLAEIQQALNRGWVNLTDEIDLPSGFARPYGPTKTFLAGPLVKRLGVSGIYSPFTGEAILLPDLPGVAFGKVMAHETAHQRGVAVEAEANFLGFMAAARSPDPYLRYSAYAFAQRQLLSLLSVEDPAAWRELRSRRLAGVQRDLDALQAYWNPSASLVGDFGTRMNDALLRSHGVEGGVLSYSDSLRLLVAYSRLSAGSLVGENFQADRGTPGPARVYPAPPGELLEEAAAE